MRRLFLATAALALFVASTGCVKKEVHQKALADLATTQKVLKNTKSNLAETEKQLSDTKTAKTGLEKEKADLSDKLTVSQTRAQTLVSKLQSLGQNVEEERSQWVKDRENLEKELESLRQMRAAAEKRSQQYAQLLDKLRAMIDAGTLSVTVRKGLMIVQLSNDILFPPGGTRLKKEGEEAIKELASTMQTFKDRRFQVLGHSDNSPINTPRYPSNWELSSQRAIEVVKILVENGVPPEMVTAAGQAEFDPLVENDTEENKSMNRRVEVIFVPTIDEMPDFSNKKSDSTAKTPPMPAASGKK